jgi:hypothetical protein
VRRLTLVLAVAGVALALSGCGATSDGDVVASVDDIELDRDTFEQLVNDREAASGNPVDSQPDADAARTDGQTARDVAGQFITLELVRKDLEEMGEPVPEVDSSLTGAEKFDAEYQAVGTAWVNQGGEVLGSPALQNWYAQGPTESGIACVQHILVGDTSEAQAVLERLDAGEAFADVAAETSLDTQSAVEGGVLGCRPMSNFSATFIPEFVDASLAAEVGVPTEPVESEFGQHVIRVIPFEELGGDDLILARLIALGQWHDVETDPEIGTWEWINVTQLG